MIYYPLQSNNIILNPLFEDDAFHQLKVLCNNQEFIQNSRVFTNELNLSDSNFMIEKLRLVEGYWFHNRLFSIVDKKTNKPTGIAGLKNIDWIEHRAEIVLIMDNDSIKSKLSYEPIKVMCKKAFQEWNLRRLWIRIFSKDSYTKTVLKGFGFSIEGRMREEIYMDGEYIDLEILGILKNEFHTV